MYQISDNLLRKKGMKEAGLMVGEVLNHFDTALYGFMAPLLAPLFFPGHDSLVGLILVYSVFATGILGRPLGAYLFGMLASFQSPQKALKISLLGVSLSMIFFGSLPPYDRLGFYSPLLLVMARFLLDFFVSGERTVAGLYLLENKDTTAAFRLAAFYESAGMLGILAASLAAFILSTCSCPLSFWRLPFWLGSAIGLIGFLFRYETALKNPDVPPIPFIYSWKQLHQKLWTMRLDVLRIAFISAFSYLTYAIAFVFLNAYIPQISQISFDAMMKFNTLFLGINLVLPLLLAPVLKNFSPHKMMRVATIMILLTTPLFFCFLKDASFGFVTTFRLWVILWGVIFTVPITLLKKRLFPGDTCYLFSGIGTQLGSGLLGRNTTSILLTCIYFVGHSWGASIYIVFLAPLTLLALRNSQDPTRGLDSKTTNLYLHEK